MSATTLTAVLLALMLGLAACGDDRAAQESERERNFGAGVGETYKGMMDEAGRTADQLNEQMQRTGDRVRERD